MKMKISSVVIIGNFSMIGISLEHGSGVDSSSCQSGIKRYAAFRWAGQAVIKVV